MLKSIYFLSDVNSDSILKAKDIQLVIRRSLMPILWINITVFCDFYTMLHVWRIELDDSISSMCKIRCVTFLWLIGSALAEKVLHRDSLARFLNQRPQQEELVQRHIIPVETEEERLEHRQQIGATLNRQVTVKFHL